MRGVIGSTWGVSAAVKPRGGVLRNCRRMAEWMMPGNFMDIDGDAGPRGRRLKVVSSCSAVVSRGVDCVVNDSVAVCASAEWC